MHGLSFISSSAALLVGNQQLASDSERGKNALLKFVMRVTN